MLAVFRIAICGRQSICTQIVIHFDSLINLKKKEKKPSVSFHGKSGTPNPPGWEEKEKVKKKRETNNNNKKKKQKKERKGEKKEKEEKKKTRKKTA